MFRWVAVALVIGLLVKDLAFVGDRYVIRVIVEVACLLLGMRWLATRASIPALRRQAAPLVYLIVILFSATVSAEPLDVAMQAAAMGAVFVFAIAYFRSVDPALAVDTLLVPTVWTYCLVLIGCLAYGKLYPGNAFAYEWGDPVPRFRGLFGEPAQLGIVSGLALGFALFVRTWWPMRCLAGVVSSVALYYTFSRTFWIAVAVSMAATLWIYKPRWRLVLVAAGIVVGLGGFVYLDTIVASNQRLLRAESLTNLSGRTEIWKIAIGRFAESPVLGYGFTVGADAMMSDAVIQNLKKQSGSDGRFVNTPTLHNGYVQALLDTGALGLLLYVLIVFGAVIRLWRTDTEKRFVAVMYALIFSAVGNIGETYIFGAAQSHQVLYWMLAIFALGYVRVAHNERPTSGARVRPSINWVTAQG